MRPVSLRLRRQRLRHSLSLRQRVALRSDGAIALTFHRLLRGVSADGTSTSVRAPARATTGVLEGVPRCLREQARGGPHLYFGTPLMRDCCPDQELFVVPIFNLQHYAPGEGFKRWHCDWTIGEEATEPVHRVLAWILYCNTVDEAGTEFHWQEHHEPAERGKLLIFPAGPSHIHRGRVNDQQSKLIATGWINAGSRDAYLRRLAAG